MKTIRLNTLNRENFIAALLTAWEAEGNRLGTDKYIEINRLLTQLPSEYDLAQLKTFLTPILTSNAQEQNTFYSLFDTVLSQITQQHTDHIVAVKEEQEKLYWRKVKHQSIKKVHNLRYALLIGFVCLIATVFIWKYLFLPKHYNDVRTICKAREKKKLCFTLQGNDKVSKVVQKSSNIHINSAQTGDNEFCVSYYTDHAGIDTLICLMESSNKAIGTVRMIIVSNPQFQWVQAHTEDKKDKSTTPSVSNTSKDTLGGFQAQNFSQKTDLEEINGQYIENYSSSWEFGLGNAYFSVEKGLIVLVALGLVIGLAAYYRYRSQKFSLSPHDDANDLYNWTIKIPNYGLVSIDRHFYNAITELRKRDKSEGLRLDIPKTVRSTIDNAGLINFQYTSQFLNKQYLFFIDKTHNNRFSTQLYDLMANWLIENEVPIELFYFSTETELCWNSKYKNGLTIKDVHHKYTETPIVIWSGNYAFLEKSVWHLWRKRVVMTPVPVSNWSEKEAILNQKFRLLPASSQGLALLAETIETIEPKGFNHIKAELLAQLAPLSILLNSMSVNSFESLQNLLIVHKNGVTDDRLLRWVAACAVPPTLFWDWILYTGARLSLNGENFLNIDNLTIIGSLPFFENGKIPNDMRSALLKWLSAEHHFEYLKILQDWEMVLKAESNIPPRGSMQWYGHRIQVLLTELLQNPKQAERRRLEIELDRLINGESLQDALLLQYLNDRQSPMDNVLSDRFRQLLQVKEHVFWKWRDWTWQAPSVLAVLIATLFVNYTEPVTTFHFGDSINVLNFTPDGKSFLVVNGKGNINMCSIESQTLQGVKTLRDIVEVGAFNQGENMVIYAAAKEGDILTWQSTTNSRKLIPSTNGIMAVDIFPHSSKVLAGYYGDNTAKLFDLSKGKEVEARFQHSHAISDVCFSRDGMTIATASHDHTAKLWSSNGQLLTVFQHNDIVHSIDISPDGSLIVTGNRDNTARLWSREGKLLKVLKGHNYDVYDVHFSHNGQQILTASGDNTAKLWNLKGDLLRTLLGHRTYIKTTAFSPDDSCVITGDSEGKVKLWALKK